jgi:LCP family protein required for cell wall assembly
LKTTLKRGVGRSAGANGNGHSVFPPGPISTISRYRQPPLPERSGFGIFWRILAGTLLAVLSIGLAVAGGSYLWFHKTVDDLKPTSKDKDVIVAQQTLDVPVAHKPAVALVVGYDFRYGDDPKRSRSDTLMLLRADPETKSISMLSFPRDLLVDVYCPGSTPVKDRINSAYSRCGSAGTLETVRKLTGLQINYLITVNFRGFRQIVDKLGGVWLDIDRRYYNHNDGRISTAFADINLQPGYQRLSGANALAFVRFRHTDDDYHRLARQQQFVRSFKEQISNDRPSLGTLLKIISVITDNVVVGAKEGFNDRTVLQYAVLAATLPGGHLFQAKIEGVSGYSELTAPEGAVANAVQQFVNPDVGASRAANNAALGRKPKKAKTPAPKDTTVTVLNGNGVPGSAASASYQLAQRGYITLLPPANADPNAPTQDYFHSQIYFDPKQKGAKPAALALEKLVEPADVKPMPKTPALRALDPGAMLLFVTGQTFHDSVGTVPTPSVEETKPEPANVVYDPSPGRGLVEQYRGKTPFKLMVPTIVERSSQPDPAYGDTPARLYWIDRDHKAVRLVFRTGAGEYWGVEETDWEDAPVLGDRSFRHRLKGRDYDFYYSGEHLHMVVLRQGGATYWVVNTLLDKLSNKTMLAIAKGLKPLGPAK